MTLLPSPRPRRSRRSARRKRRRRLPRPRCPRSPGQRTSSTAAPSGLASPSRTRRPPLLTCSRSSPRCAAPISLHRADARARAHASKRRTRRRPSHGRGLCVSAAHRRGPRPRRRRWKELSDEEKQKWQAEAAADKERYITEARAAAAHVAFALTAALARRSRPAPPPAPFGRRPARAVAPRRVAVQGGRDRARGQGGAQPLARRPACPAALAPRPVLLLATPRPDTTPSLHPFTTAQGRRSVHPTRHVCRAGPLRGHASLRLGRRPAQEKEDKEKKPQKPKSAFALYCVKERASVKEVRRSRHGGPTRHLSPPLLCRAGQRRRRDQGGHQAADGAVEGTLRGGEAAV